MLIDSLKLTVAQNPEVDPFYLRILLKEQLQLYVLNFIYGSAWGENLIFKGGSCLRIFFGLPRLSEDLDLDILNTGAFNLDDFLTYLKNYFSQTLQYKDISLKISGKKNIIYLKFPLLDKLGLAWGKGETKILFLRVDLVPAVGNKFKTEISLKSTYDFSFIVNRYSLSDLFTGKVAAILQRMTKVGERIEPRTKGRDYFDLIWFLEKKTSLNLAYLKELTKIRNKKELKELLFQRVEKLDLTVLAQDLRPLFKNQKFVDDLVGNYKKLAKDLLIGF